MDQQQEERLLRRLLNMAGSDTITHIYLDAHAAIEDGGADLVDARRIMDRLSRQGAAVEEHERCP